MARIINRIASPAIESDADWKEPAPGSDAGEAIAALLARYGPRLRGLALRLCGNHADADDMVQEVFLHAYRGWASFKGQSRASTWLHAIAARSCRTRSRRKGGIDRRMPAVSQLMPWGETTITRIAAAGRDDEPVAERNEAIARVQNEIVRLPEHLRLPLVLKEMLQLDIGQTAAALGLAENTVKTRLHRARLALRKGMMSGVRAVRAPTPIYDKQVCMDLLKLKMSTMDHGGTAAGFVVPQAEVCARCRAVFRELDIVQEACAQMAGGTMPHTLRERIMREIRRGEDADEPRKRGRRPVRAR